MNKKNKNKSEIELLVDSMKKRNTLQSDEETIVYLENALDYYCILAKRDIFIMLPEKENERIPYLKKEISITLERINSDSILGGQANVF